MGRGRRRPSGLLQVPLSGRDDEETIAKQWAALREAFLSDRQVQTDLAEWRQVLACFALCALLCFIKCPW